MLWCGVESIHVVEQQDHATDGGGTHQSAEKLPRLLFAGSGTDPVTDLQIGDKSAGHGEGGAHHTSYDHRSHDAGCAVQSYGHKYGRSDD